MKAVFIFPFGVFQVDPMDLGATIIIAQAFCSTSFHISTTHNNCLFTYSNKLVCVGFEGCVARLGLRPQKL